MPKRELKPLVLRGIVTSERVKCGTASEHLGSVLRTSEGARYVLQRIGGNPFDDARTRELVGHQVTVEGFPVGGLFRYVSVKVED